MSVSFDAEVDPFAEFTAEDFEVLETNAIQASQSQQPALNPITRQVSFIQHQPYQNVLPKVEEDSVMDEDYGQFTVDDEDLIIEDQPDTNTNVSALQTGTLDSHSERISVDSSSLLQELAHLRAEATRLKQERDKYETQLYNQDGKMDHLQRALQKSKMEHENALEKLHRTADAEKKALQAELNEKERKLARLSGEIEFQKNELREARELATKGPVIRPPGEAYGNGKDVSHGREMGFQGNGIELSPKKARVARGSGIKSPESKNRISRAFGKGEVVTSIRGKKRKLEEQRVTPEPVVMVEDVKNEVLSEEEINRLVMEKILRDRSVWEVSDERFELLRDILAHRMEDGVDTFSAMDTVTFKAEAYPISIFLVHEITTRTKGAENEEALALLLCTILSELWDRSLRDEAYTALIYIQSLLNYLLTRCYSACKQCLTLSPSPIHLAQSTIELHAAKRIYNKDFPQLPYQAVLSSLTVLYTLSCGIESTSDLHAFWEIITVNFTVMLLHTKQFVHTIEGMSKLLELSVTQYGFGPRGDFEDEGVQRDPIGLVLDKLTLNLIEKPRAGCSREELWSLRQTIIHTMSEIVAGHAKGSKILHDAGFVLPRVTSLLASEIEYFYAHPRNSDQSVILSKACVRLLHAIIMPHSPDTLSHYLAPFPGAQQAHTVAMTRLSFAGESETVFVDVADMARDLLEAAVSPEEGDDIWGLFQWGEEMDTIGGEVDDELSAFMD